MPKMDKSKRCYIFDRWHMEFVRRFYIGRDNHGHPIPGADYHVTTTPGLVLAKAFQNPNCAARRAAILNNEIGRQRYIAIDEEQARIREKYMDCYRRRAGL